ncbi:MAG: hypothetical protein F2832_02800 [Actinobacteria bacterium]|nr:hypothetical protein [Actinomycetota bacterium]
MERWFEEGREREQRRRDACSSKRRFATEAEARAIAAQDRAAYGDRFSPYRCDLCEDWHLTRDRSAPPERR